MKYLKHDLKACISDCSILDPGTFIDYNDTQNLKCRFCDVQ